MARRIGIFVGTLGTQAGGMETYELNLVRTIAQIDKETHYTIYCMGEEAPKLIGVEQDNIHYHVLSRFSRALTMSVTLPWVLHRSSCELIHPTYVPPAICPKPYIYTIHSSVTWVHPEFYPPAIRWRVNRLQEKGIRESRALMCVSKNTRDYIAEKFKVPEERLSVVYHGISNEFKPVDKNTAKQEIEKKYNISAPFFLSVAKLKENKNISRLIKAHSLFERQHKLGTKLVLAGRRLWTKGSLNEELDAAVASGQVIELGNVEHQDLPLLYSAALGLAFVSLWEGFGIPIIEAQACGTPVLTSNNSSMPEAAGGHAILVDPYDIEAIADGMAQIATDSEQCKDLIELGIYNAKRFSWEATAKQTIEAYQKALG